MKNHEKMFCSIATLVPALLFAESHPLEDTETVLVPGTVEIVADFSGTNPPTRVVRDFLTPCDMSKGGEVSFDIFCEDIGQFSKFMVYFGSGAGWYITYFSPEKCGEWEHCRIRVGRKKTSSEGAAAGWDKVGRIRFSLSRAGTSKSIIRLRDIRYSSHAEEDPPEVVAARRVKAHERLLSMPGKAGERRFAWCHTEYGPFNGDWDKGAKELRDCGFTDIIVNLCCGANAAYESAVMEPARSVAKYGDMLEPCKEACRKYGLKLHVWRLCWRVRWTSKEAVDRLESDGLLQRNIRGGVERDWLCPSNPRNREREIAAMMELVGKGVDGIHFDTIRYVLGCDCYIFIRPADLRNNAGFPTKFTEAVTCGVPVIASEVSVVTDYQTERISFVSTPDEKGITDSMNDMKNKKYESNMLNNTFDYRKHKNTAALWLHCVICGGE